MSAYHNELRVKAKQILLERTVEKSLEKKTSDMLCLLCRSNLATQPNSHIIPKFLSKDIFSDLKEAYVTQADEMDSKPQIIYDTPKEDFIICPSCEKYFSVLETYVSTNPYQNLWSSEKQNEFNPIDSNHEFTLLECKATNPVIFNLFIYSIMWRIFISTNNFFKHIKVNHKTIEGLRKTLVAYKAEGLNQLKVNSKSIKFPLHKSKYTITTCEDFVNDRSYNIVGAVPAANPYLILLSRFQLKISFTENKEQNYLSPVNNIVQSEDLIRIVKCSRTLWLKLKGQYQQAYNQSAYKYLIKNGRKAFDIEVFLNGRKHIRNKLPI